jgi:hypothetical protein
MAQIINITLMLKRVIVGNVTVPEFERLVWSTFRRYHLWKMCRHWYAVEHPRVSFGQVCTPCIYARMEGLEVNRSISRSPAGFRFPPGTAFFVCHEIQTGHYREIVRWYIDYSSWSVNMFSGQTVLAAGAGCSDTQVIYQCNITQVAN